MAVENNNSGDLDVGSQLDKDLDAFIGTTTGDTSQEGGDQTGQNQQGNQQQQQRGQQGDNTQARQGNNQQQQTGQGDAGNDGNLSRSQIPQTPRQYGSLFRSDLQGNIVDAAGRQIARSGAERRIFERTYAAVSGIETQYAATKQKLDAYENADTAAKEAGLSIEERAMGLRLMSAWKQDKLKTLNFLLTQASQSGTDVSSIRAGGVDMAALSSTVKQLIADGVAPFQFLLQQQQQQQQQQELGEHAAQELTTFYQEFPDSRLHADSIARVMDAKGWDLRAAYFALKSEAAVKGWDWSKPLQSQAQATIAAGQNGGGGNNNQRRQLPTGGGNNQRLPAMNGSASGSDGTSNMRSAEQTQEMSHDASWEDIIRHAAGKAGVRLDS